MTDPVREPARAKLNLRLRVLGRDGAGYHALETVFLRLDLADRVEVAPGADGIDLEVDPASSERFGAPGDRSTAAPSDPGEREVPEGPDNLCWRAALAFYEALDEPPDVSIRLAKRVPAAGGLGGGSADAAAVLRGLSRLHGEPLPPETLMRLAGELGSDVPFALLDRPMALGWERGRRLMPLDPPPPRPMLLLVPEARVSTAEAYRWLDADRARARGEEPADRPGGAEEAPADGGSGRGSHDAAAAPAPDVATPHPAAALPRAPDLSRWGALLPLRGNDFEPTVFSRLPELAWWKEELLGEGAEAALLCGSGSTMCGIFGDARRRDVAADRLRESGELRVLTTRGPA